MLESESTGGQLDGPEPKSCDGGDSEELSRLMHFVSSIELELSTTSTSTVDARQESESILADNDSDESREAPLADASDLLDVEEPAEPLEDGSDDLWNQIQLMEEMFLSSKHVKSSEMLSPLEVSLVLQTPVSGVQRFLEALDTGREIDWTKSLTPRSRANSSSSDDATLPGDFFDSALTEAKGLARRNLFSEETLTGPAQPADSFYTVKFSSPKTSAKEREVGRTDTEEAAFRMFSVGTDYYYRLLKHRGKPDVKPSSAELLQWRYSLEKAASRKSGGFDEKGDHSSTVGDILIYRGGPGITMSGLEAAYCQLESIEEVRGNCCQITCTVEYLCRPDIPLGAIMSGALALARYMDIPCEMKSLSHCWLPVSDSSYSTAAASASAVAATKPFDFIDFQVCLSRDLQTRVCLLMFVKKLSPFSDNKVSAEEPLPSLNAKVLGELQRFLSASNALFSHLYLVPLTDVCVTGALDSHYQWLLYQLFVERNQLVGRDTVVEMNKQLSSAKRICQLVYNVIGPVYLQHGITLPEKPSKEALRRHRQLPSIAEKLQEKLRIAEVFDSIEHSSDLTQPAELPLHHELTEESDDPHGETDDDEDDGEEEDEDSSFDVTALSPLSTLPKDKRRSFCGPEKLSVVREKLDGMSIVLKLKDALSRSLQTRCDQELAYYLETRNQFTVTLLSFLVDYRQTLFLHLAQSLEAESSPFNRNVLLAFQKTALTDLEAVRDTKSSTPQSPHSLTTESSLPNGKDTSNAPLTRTVLPVILFNFVALVRGSPGQIYVSASHCYIVWGILFSRMVLPTRALDRRFSSEAGSASSLASAIGDSIVLSFFGGKIVFNVTPLAVDCETVKLVLGDIIEIFR